MLSDTLFLQHVLCSFSAMFLLFVWNCTVTGLWTPDRATDIHPPGSVSLLFSETLIPCSWQTCSSWIWVQMFPVPQGFRAESHLCATVSVLKWRCALNPQGRSWQSLESSFQATFHYDRNLKSYEGFTERSNRRDRGGFGHDERKWFACQRERI